MGLFSLSPAQLAYIEETLAKTPDLNKLLPYGPPKARPPSQHQSSSPARKTAKPSFGTSSDRDSGGNSERYATDIYSTRDFERNFDRDWRESRGYTSSGSHSDFDRDFDRDTESFRDR